MLEPVPRRLLLVALAAALAAAPVSASFTGDETAEARQAAQDARDTALEALPTTGTPLDQVPEDVRDPRLSLPSHEQARRDLAQNVPATGTPVDGAVQDVLEPDNDPQVDTTVVDGLRREALSRASAALQRAWGLVPDDPMGALGEQVDPITRSAVGMLPASDAYEVEQAAPASGEATLVPADVDPELLVAGASAAAAVALVAFWLASSSGSMGAAGAAGTAGVQGELRRLLPFASPLFTRFEKDTVLGHPKREQLYAFILQDPGVSLQALCDKSGLSRTAVTHHLRLLELQHLIVSKRLGRSRHYYENGGRFGRDQKDAYAVLHNARTKDVARFVRDHPGAIQKALCAALAIQPSIAHWHLKRLQEAQLVEPVRHGRTVSYFPGPGLRNLDQPVIPREAAAPIEAAPLAPMPVVRALPA